MKFKNPLLYKIILLLLFLNKTKPISEAQRELEEDKESLKIELTETKATVKKELKDAQIERDKDLNKCLPIHDAALTFDLSKLQKLLDQKTNLDSIGCFWQMTPIQYIIFKNENKKNTTLASTVKWLLENGASNLEHKEYGFGRTALHLAAMYNQPDTINILCKYNADIKAEDDDGMTPLHLAAQYNNVDAAKALINNGASLTLVKHDTSGITPEQDPLSLAIHIAAYVGSIDILNLFVNTYKQNINIPDNTGNTPLHYAAISLKTDTVKWLLDHGADKTLRDNTKKTALNQVAGMLKNLYDKYKADEKAREERSDFQNFLKDNISGAQKKISKQIVEGLNIEYPEELTITSEQDIRNHPIIKLLLPAKKE